MSKLEKGISFTVILAETSHVFCCVLPSIFSAINLLVSIGLISSMPAFMIVWHEAMHAYEIPIMLFSTGLLFVGWVFYTVSHMLDCHSGCGHEPCAPKKKRSSKLLVIATLLFLVNIFIYVTLHL